MRILLHLVGQVFTALKALFFIFALIAEILTRELRCVPLQLVGHISQSILDGALGRARSRRRLISAHQTQSHPELLDVAAWDAAILQEARLPFVQIWLAVFEVLVAEVAFSGQEAAVAAELQGPSNDVENKD